MKNNARRRRAAPLARLLPAVILTVLLLAGCTAPPESSESWPPQPGDAVSSTASSRTEEVSSEAASSGPDVVYNQETIEVPNLPVSEETFLDYFSGDPVSLPKFFNYPADEPADFAHPGNGFLFLVDQTYRLGTERGVTFEQVGSFYLIPGEMIRRTASELLGLELTADGLFAMSDGKELPRSSPMGLRRAEGTDSYYFVPALGVGEGYLAAIHEETLRFSEREISIETTLAPDEEDPNIPARHFTYYFRVVEGSRIPYQLTRITEK